jgi:response regulator RpfG family c-di-GMP phosphodiesterase
MEAKEFTILYVDDEMHNLVSFRATFRREYNILIAQSGQEGLAFMNKHHVHLIISDQRMPEMTSSDLPRLGPRVPGAVVHE